MSFLYRCTRTYKSGQFKGQKCRQRHHFKKKVEEYVNPKKCPSCKNEITKIDNWQMIQNKKNTCNCGQPHFPHQAGSSIWCIESKRESTEDDYKARYGG